MARPKSNGPYTPLSATYYRDDAILEVGEEAELMFVRCLAFLADAASDGFITERQMRIVVGMGLNNVDARVDALVGVGLIERIDGGYLIRSWLKWNKSTDEIGKHLKRDRERKSLGRESETVTDSAVIPDGIQADSRDQYNTNQITTSQVTANQTPAPSALESLFDDAYAHWPKKVERKVALERFKSATKRIPIDDLVQSIITFGDAYAATTEKQFVPALGVWLNGDRWTDDLPRKAEAKRERFSPNQERGLALVEHYREAGQ